MLTAEQVIDQEYLNARCMLIEIAAILDRHDRAATSSPPPRDGRLEQLCAAIDVLADRDAMPDRSEKLLMLFSDPA